eukprot:sb/3477369/
MVGSEVMIYFPEMDDHEPLPSSLNVLGGTFTFTILILEMTVLQCCCGVRLGSGFPKMSERDHLPRTRSAQVQQIFQQGFTPPKSMGYVLELGVSCGEHRPRHRVGNGT